MRKRTLGASGPVVSALGLGCMGMSEFYGPADETESIATIHRALDLGITFFDTADMYGSGHNEELLGRALSGRAEATVVATKFGIVRGTDPADRYIDSTPAYARRACEASLRRLGVEHVDLYYLHRRNPQVPIEDTVGAMAELVAEGKVSYLGLSEVSGETLRRACQVHPIAALQSEYSLFTRGIEDEIVPVARDLGVGIVAYSPISRGLLSGSLPATDELDSADFRRFAPRFQDSAIDSNRGLVERVRALAAEIGCTPAQCALAWLLSRSDGVVPIPGTRRTRHLEENVAAADIRLSAEQIAALERAVPPGSVLGERYADLTSLET